MRANPGSPPTPNLTAISTCFPFLPYFSLAWLLVLPRKVFGRLARGGQLPLALVLELVDEELSVLHDLRVVDPVGVEAAREVVVGLAASLRLLENSEVRAERDLHVRVVALVVLPRLQPVSPLLATPSDVGDVISVRVVEFPEPLGEQVGFHAAVDLHDRSVLDFHMNRLVHVLLQHEHHVAHSEDQDALPFVFDGSAANHSTRPDVPPSGLVRNAVDAHRVPAFLVEGPAAPACRSHAPLLPSLLDFLPPAAPP